MDNKVKNVKLIGIMGQIGSGKDTVADLIEKNTNKRFINVRYADKLKDIVCSLIGCSRETLENREFKEGELPAIWQLSKKEKRTPRFMLQKIGQTVREKIHPNSWVNATFSTWDTSKLSWIVRDVRYQNEADAIIERGGVIIQVIRPLELRAQGLHSSWKDSKWSRFIPFKLWLFFYDRAKYKMYTHESENIEKIKVSKNLFLIYNNGSLSQLESVVKGILESEVE